jgi:hypothetical protein
MADYPQWVQELFRKNDEVRRRQQEQMDKQMDKLTEAISKLGNQANATANATSNSNATSNATENTTANATTNATASSTTNDTSVANENQPLRANATSDSNVTSNATENTTANATTNAMASSTANDTSVANENQPLRAEEIYKFQPSDSPDDIDYYLFSDRITELVAQYGEKRILPSLTSCLQNERAKSWYSTLDRARRSTLSQSAACWNIYLKGDFGIKPARAKELSQIEVFSFSQNRPVSTYLDRKIALLKISGIDNEDKQCVEIKDGLWDIEYRMAIRLRPTNNKVAWLRQKLIDIEPECHIIWLEAQRLSRNYYTRAIKNMISARKNKDISPSSPHHSSDAPPIMKKISASSTKSRKIDRSMFENKVSHVCDACKKPFACRNQLFEHLKETNHFIMKSVNSSNNETTIVTSTVKVRDAEPVLRNYNCCEIKYLFDPHGKAEYGRLDTTKGISLADENLVANLPSANRIALNNAVNVKDSNGGAYRAREVVTFTFYLPDGQRKRLARITGTFHLVQGLDCGIVFGNNIIGPEGIVIDVFNKKAIVTSCNGITCALKTTSPPMIDIQPAVQSNEDSTEVVVEQCKDTNDVVEMENTTDSASINKSIETVEESKDAVVIDIIDISPDDDVASAENDCSIQIAPPSNISLLRCKKRRLSQQRFRFAKVPTSVPSHPYGLRKVSKNVSASMYDRLKYFDFNKASLWEFYNPLKIMDSKYSLNKFSIDFIFALPPSCLFGYGNKVRPITVHVESCNSLKWPQVD